jgi:hypothetical protein
MDLILTLNILYFTVLAMYWSKKININKFFISLFKLNGKKCMKSLTNINTAHIKLVIYS